MRDDSIFNSQHGRRRQASGPQSLLPNGKLPKRTHFGTGNPLPFTETLPAIRAEREATQSVPEGGRRRSPAIALDRTESQSMNQITAGILEPSTRCPTQLVTPPGSRLLALPSETQAEREADRRSSRRDGSGGGQQFRLLNVPFSRHDSAPEHAAIHYPLSTINFLPPPTEAIAPMNDFAESPLPYAEEGLMRWTVSESNQGESRPIKANQGCTRLHKDRNFAARRLDCSARVAPSLPPPISPQSHPDPTFDPTAFTEKIPPIPLDPTTSFLCPFVPFRGPLREVPGVG